MKYKKKILPNGLTIITVPMPSFESATALVMVGVGSRYENRDNSGISHFLEHMLFKGTKRRSSSFEINSLVDGIGGEFNAFTSKEFTGYYIKGGKNNIEICIDLLADMAQNPLLDQEEVDKEKGVIIEEINMYEDTPMRHLGDIYERLLYGDTPMGWDTSGNKDVIRGMHRNDFVKYIKNYYSPSNMLVVLAGGIDEELGIKMVEKHFGVMKIFKSPKPKKTPNKQSKPQVLIEQKKTEQAHIAIGLRTASLVSPDRYSLSVLASVLGGGMSSRMFSEVRDKRGLAYYIRVNSELHTDLGSFVVSAGVTPSRIDESIVVILAELKDIRDGKKKISKEELKKAKEFMKGHLVMELEDSQSVSIYYSMQHVLQNDINNPDEALKKIDSVTVEDVQKVAKKYFTEKGLNLAIIGNFGKDKKTENANRQRFEKLLKL